MEPEIRFSVRSLLMVIVLLLLLVNWLAVTIFIVEALYSVPSLAHLYYSTPASTAWTLLVVWISSVFPRGNK